MSDQALLELAAMARLRHLAFVDSVHVAQAECLAALIELCVRLLTLQRVAVEMPGTHYLRLLGGTRVGSCEHTAALVRAALVLRGRGEVVVEMEW